MKTRGRRSGFTLIEILVFIAIFSIIIVSFITILTTVTQLQVRQSSAAYVAEQSQSLIQQIQYYVESARLVDMPLGTPMNTLTFWAQGTSSLPGAIFLSSGIVEFEPQFFGPSPFPISGEEDLTSDKVTVSNLSFTLHNSSTSRDVSGSGSISFSFTMSAGAPDTSQFYSENFRSSVTALSPISKIQTVQQNGLVDTGFVPVFGPAPLYQTIGAEAGSYFDYPPEEGDVLLAIVETTPSTTLMASDTALTWNDIGDFSYPHNNSRLSLFEAVMSTSTEYNAGVSFILGTTNIQESGMFLYDFRGLSSSSPLDTISSQVQSSTQTPSGGIVYPTSTFEKIIGITMTDSSLEVPSPQKGFSFESSSSAESLPFGLFVEDRTQYVTGPVSAGWQYSQTTPSSSLSVILTLK